MRRHAASRRRGSRRGGSLAGRLPEDGSGLVVTHGGNIELAATLLAHQTGARLGACLWATARACAFTIDQWPQLLLRALIFRIVVNALAERVEPWRLDVSGEYRSTIDLVLELTKG